MGSCRRKLEKTIIFQVSKLAQSTSIPSIAFCRGSTGSQANSGTATVLVNELNAARLEGPSDDILCGSSRLIGPGFELTNGDDADAGFAGEALLAPVQQTAGGPALFGSDRAHAPSLMRRPADSTIASKID
jgi:hypothetical protein